MIWIIALVGGLIGGLLSHFFLTKGLLLVMEIRMTRARAAAMEAWRIERSALKDELKQLKIRFLSIEKHVTGKPAKVKK